MWKDFFYFTRSERRGIIVLVVLIIMVFTGSFLLSECQNRGETVNDVLFEKEYDDFISSLYEKQQKSASYNSHEEYEEIVLTSFDPNTADSITFLRLGLSSWTASNIIRYRAKGGLFGKPEDFKKMYGITPQQYSELLPYIAINNAFSVKEKDTVQVLVKQERKISTEVFKYPARTSIDLNNADTTELKKIPGIGSGTAGAIVAYRQKLGGFYSVSQLEDIHLSNDRFSEWFTVENGNTTRINLNKVSIERLRAHPYFNFYQAKVIIEYRKKRGVLKTLKQLALYEEFNEKDFERMEHYVSFE
ncbi:hypothetical protein EZS27_036021 [termite gut metagenome]|uniref:ComE operon protein 1 n=1 Tax=termite gut metagenome TaxID=433724 RepID=A0A5J4PX08_9ZZZZ